MLNKAMEEYHQSLKNPSTRKPSRIGAKAGHLFCLGGEGAESRVEVYHSNVNRLGTNQGQSIQRDYITKIV